MSKIHDDDVDHYGVHIAHGCVGNCTYCGSCRATGRLKSVEPHLVLDKVLNKWANDYTPMLLGEDVGAYGIDISTNIITLLDLLHNRRPNDNCKVILDNMEVQWLINYYDGFRRHLDNDFIVRVALGVQSFSSDLLRKMNRRYEYDCCELAGILREIADARMSRSGLDWCDQLDIHLLAGYSGESREEFRMTEKVINRIFRNSIPFCASPFFRHVGMTLPDDDLDEAEYSFRVNALYAAAGDLPLPWICQGCGQKKYHCICHVNMKGKML
jgi:tRNA A37 methylthiotransferase MiaB